MPVNDERIIRSAQCQRKFGQDSQYNPDIDLYKYKTSTELLRKLPFDPKDCVPVNYTKLKTDKHHRYYTEISSPVHCYKAKGTWSNTSLNRRFPEEAGTCWTTPGNAKCARKHVPDALVRKNGAPINHLKQRAQSDCTKDPNCQWMPENDDCMSKKDYEAYIESILPDFPETWPQDATKANMATFLEQYYHRKLFARPPAFLSIQGQGDRCNTPANAPAPPPLPSLPQTVVNQFFKGIARHHATTTNRGLLVWHSTGSGKTCTAAGIMEAFWDTPKTIVFASSVEALANNPPSNFHACAYKYFPRFQQLTAHAKTEDEKAAIMKAAFEQRGVHFMSFAKLAHHLLIARPLKLKSEAEKDQHRRFLQNAILIIDEVHNIFKPLPTQAAEHTALKHFLSDVKNKYSTHLQIAVLTATPGETPEEAVELLNMVRDRNAPPIVPPDPARPQTLDAFRSAIKGMISYYDTSSDSTRFPVVQDPPEPITVPMSVPHYKKYVEAFEGIKPEKKDYDALQKKEKLGDYYKPARKYANMLFNYEKGLSLADFSAKLPSLLKEIQKYPQEKQYVYSAFYENRGYGGQGAPAIAQTLEKELRYERLTVKDAIDYNKAGKLPSKGRRRYVLITLSELKHGKLTAGEALQHILKIYNHPDNRYGELIHVMVASQQFNEGMDLKAVRHIHIFDPLLSINKELQTIGRAARYCSHKDLSRRDGQWKVLIHRYLADYPHNIKLFSSAKQLATLESDKAALKIAEQELASMGRGKKGDNAHKQKKEELKEHIKQLQVAVKGYTKSLKELQDLDPSRVAMIDPELHKQVRERYKRMMVTLLAMKEAAIDCRLLHGFHRQLTPELTCRD